MGEGGEGDFMVMCFKYLIFSFLSDHPGILPHSRVNFPTYKCSLPSFTFL